MKTVNKVKIKVLPHDYDKKIDEIIASGKPINEQLEDMLTMLGGKIITCEPVVTQNVTSSPK